MSWHVSPCPWLRGTGAGSRTPPPPASHLPQPPMEVEDRGDTPPQGRAHTTSTDLAPCPSSECTAAVSPAGCPQKWFSPEPTLPKPLLPAQPGALVPSPATPPARLQAARVPCGRGAPSFLHGQRKPCREPFLLPLPLLAPQLQPLGSALETHAPQGKEHPSAHPKRGGTERLQVPGEV